MRYKYLLLLMVPVLMFSCKKERGTYMLPPPPAPPVHTVLLKDIEQSNLVSPYYHFEYDTTGKISLASFAYSLDIYDVKYDGDRISEMKNRGLVNKDRLQYFYDNAGRVSVVQYVNLTGLVYKRSFFSYDGPRLIAIERQQKLGNGFIIEKTMTMSYYADGNLLEMIEHFLPVNGNNEATFTDRYEKYDNKINTDGFSLIHDDFFDNLILLPGVQLQKNNPGKVTHTGDGDNYKIDYAYTYNAQDAPLTKNGEFLNTSGPKTGQKAHFSLTFTYY